MSNYTKFSLFFKMKSKHKHINGTSLFFLSIRVFKFNIMKKFLMVIFMGLDLKLHVIFRIYP